MRFDKNDLEEGLIGGMLAAVILLLYILSCLGCSTTACPPCVPTVETVTIRVPVLSCPKPLILPALVYPAWPEIPTDPTDEELKKFYAAVVATVGAREQIFLDRIDADEKIIDLYRD